MDTGYVLNLINHETSKKAESNKFYYYFLTFAVVTSVYHSSFFFRYTTTPFLTSFLFSHSFPLSQTPRHAIVSWHMADPTRPEPNIQTQRRSLTTYTTNHPNPIHPVVRVMLAHAGPAPGPHPSFLSLSSHGPQFSGSPVQCSRAPQWNPICCKPYKLQPPLLLPLTSEREVK
ncbi:hypothetical protein VTJ04DRAFT_4736 [Mycothermus thermophilus]|uniref:uncharacterized protein n=1 Tax=Humicola insolens TaxID=85995 RepID=UPI00374291FC